MSREERLIAYVDGELPPTDAAAFEAELAADARLAAEVEQQRRLRARIAAVYGPVADEPTPDHLILAACAANENRSRFGKVQFAAMAASLVIGAFVGFLVPHGPAGGLAPGEGGLVARGGLADALDSRLSSEASPIRVGLSFRDEQGAYCRAFQSTPDRLAGVACREPEGWVARATTAWRPAAATQYRTASSELPPLVLSAIDELIAGDPLDAAGERAARDRGWMP
ncbi:anti-sigma factor [Phenylobacterium sp.]|uniref:anti-sigma factor family protein n=1 Tax=Phenylobacterium sp. TaxID=1871053 RepID=UPI0035AF88D7